MKHIIQLLLLTIFKLSTKNRSIKNEFDNKR